ncbi:MAG: hypothetical protein SAJ12_20550, partial [Jaaginema sp. PMC 1079.18]|nr:hypothetical protein [Jaaginema sp. PMC 1079.18]
CNTTFIERESEQWLKIINLFGAKFGDIIKLFRDLPDFRIFQLTPQEGRFVIGFGAAYQVNLAGETDLLPIQGKSHSQS